MVECFNLDEIPTKLYFHVRENTTFDKEKNRVNAPNYTMGSQEQQRQARTDDGKKPLFQ